MINTTRLLVNEVRAYLERGYSPLDIARSFGCKVDDILYIIQNLLT